MSYDRLTIDTTIRPGPEDLPLRRARTLANEELRQRARLDEIEWLHANPLLWLRALIGIVKDVDKQLSMDGLDLKKIPGKKAGSPDHETYLKARQEIIDRKQVRIHFRGLASNRADEVASLCGPGPLIMAGAVIAGLETIAQMIEEDDPDAAAGMARSLARRLLKENRGEPAPDNRSAGPVTVKLAGMLPGTLIVCRACQRGKADPAADSSRCSRCGQLHRFS